MKYKIIKNRQLIKDNNFAGYKGENRAETLEFDIPLELQEYTKTINFQTDDGNFFDILDSNIYIIKNNLTKYDEVRFFIEFTKQISENEIQKIKTSVATLPLKSSFDVGKEITEEEIQILDALIVKLEAATNRANAISEDLEEKVAADYYRGKPGDSYVITTEDYEEIGNNVKEDIQPTLDNNLQLAKDYADSIKPTKTSELTNDSNFSTTNQNNNFSAPQTINGTLTINGDIVQNGEQYETHAEQVYTKNDEIITRDGAVGGLSEGEYTGIQAEKYDGTNNGRLGFNAKGEARVGDIGDEQPLLTRDEIVNLQEGQVLIWDGKNLKAVGSSDFVKNTDFANISKAGVSKMWTSTNEDGEIGLNISTEV